MFVCVAANTHFESRWNQEAAKEKGKKKINNRSASQPRREPAKAIPVTAHNWLNEMSNARLCHTSEHDEVEAAEV